MKKISTLADVVAWLKQWERDRAAGLVPESEEAHRRLVIDLLRPFAEEDAARPAGGAQVSAPSAGEMADLAELPRGRDRDAFVDGVIAERARAGAREAALAAEVQRLRDALREALDAREQARKPLL